MDNFLNRVNKNETVRKFVDIALLFVYCSWMINAVAAMVEFLIIDMLVLAAVTFYIGKYLVRRSSRWLVPLAVSPALFCLLLIILREVGFGSFRIFGILLSNGASNHLQYYLFGGTRDALISILRAWGALRSIAYLVIVLAVGTCYALMINASCRRQAKKLGLRLVELVQQGKKEPVAEALQRGADANAVDADGVPALVLALGNMEIFRLLLERGANAKAAVNVANAKGVPALVHALNDGEIFKLLLEHGADVNASDEAGKTALMHAIEMGNMEAAKLLLAHGVDINAADAQGQTLLEYATKAKNTEAASLLLDLGAPIDVAKDGGELLALAAKNNDMELARRLVNMGVNPQAATQSA